MPDIVMTPGDKNPNRYRKHVISMAMVALIAGGAGAPQILGLLLNETEADRLHAYQDGEKIWTICKGLTVYQGKPVHQGMVLTQAQCDVANEAFIKHDLAEAESIMRPEVWARMSEPARAAIGDMVHNLGKAKTRDSSAVRLLNAGNVNDGCAAITLWIRDRGRDCRKQGSNCQGQPTRRMKGDELCLMPNPA